LKGNSNIQQTNLANIRILESNSNGCNVRRRLLVS